MTEPSRRLPTHRGTSSPLMPHTARLIAAVILAQARNERRRIALGEDYIFIASTEHQHARLRRETVKISVRSTLNSCEKGCRGGSQSTWPELWSMVKYFMRYSNADTRPHCSETRCYSTRDGGVHLRLFTGADREYCWWPYPSRLLPTQG